VRTDIVLGADLGQPLLSLEELPASRQITRILVAVGVADHDRLLAAEAFQMAVVDRMCEERAHGRGGFGQIGARLKERHDGQCFGGAVLLQVEARPAGQQQHGKYVGRAACHADDVGADEMRAVEVHGPLQGAEEIP
jgi:hypothetical protein